MHFPPLSRCCSLVLLAGLLLGGATSCRKKKPVAVADPGKVALALLENQIGSLSAPIYRQQRESPIHWQPWTQETLDRAKEAKRLLFVVVALPQQTGYQSILKEYDQDPMIVKTINEKFVPVLVDGDSVREIGLLTAQLCAEIKQPLELPLLLWMTHEGNPVAWIPVPSQREATAARLFHQSNEMVSRMWSEDPHYVLKNSALDNESRRSRILDTEDGRASADPAGDSLQAARQLHSLYDTFSRTIDEAGGLFPAGVIDTLSTAALAPGVPENIRDRCRETTAELMKDLLPSAMFDPLEGGVFSGRTTTNWTLPNFSWNCGDQARVACTLLRCHQLTGDPIALARALDLLAFAERKFRNEEGLFSETSTDPGPIGPWLWTTEEIEKALPADAAKEWIAATGMSAQGNLPSESDPSRTMFRKNSLALVRPLAETAAQLSIPPADFQKRFEESRKKLLEVRTARLNLKEGDRIPHVATNFRMVSAYASAYAATGDPVWREKATALLALAKSRFSEGNRLNNYGEAGPATWAGARSFIYALAIQAAQDVADITLDEKPLEWANELAVAASEHFIVDEITQEAATDQQLIKLPIKDIRKIFDDTSGGLYALAFARQSLGDPALKRLVSPLAGVAIRKPILYSDTITAALVQHQSRVVVFSKDLPPALKMAVERLPLQVIPRRPAKDSDGIPAGSVRVISPDGTGKIVAEPSALMAELLLPDKKP